MGRKDPTYSDEQIAQLISLVTEQAWSITQAADNVGIARETARTYISKHLRDTPPIQGDNPIGQMAQRLTQVANTELVVLEHQAKNPNNKRTDLDRAGKLAKLLLDLDKLRKANAAPPKKDGDNPLDKLTPSNAKTQRKSGSVADAQGFLPGETPEVEPVGSGPMGF